MFPTDASIDNAPTVVDMLYFEGGEILLGCNHILLHRLLYAVIPSWRSRNHQSLALEDLVGRQIHYPPRPKMLCHFQREGPPLTKNCLSWKCSSPRLPRKTQRRHHCSSSVDVCDISHVTLSGLWWSYLYQIEYRKYLFFPRTVVLQIVVASRQFANSAMGL